jgi:hypothetical protein
MYSMSFLKWKLPEGVNQGQKSPIQFLKSYLHQRVPRATIAAQPGISSTATWSSHRLISEVSVNSDCQSQSQVAYCNTMHPGVNVFVSRRRPGKLAMSWSQHNGIDTAIGHVLASQSLMRHC